MPADIFIQIPAYRDTELSHTLKDLLRKASSKHTLRICVLWQHGDSDPLDDELWNNEQVRIIDIPHTESKGHSWARSVLQKYWEGEKYSLLLDSHHRFVKNWDLLLIDMFEGLKKKGIERPVISSYLPKYDPNREPYGRVQYPLKIYPLEDQRFKGIIHRLSGYPLAHWKWLEGPIPADFVCLHFLFTEGRFNTEVPFSDQNYYAGDEVLASMKLFTHGYNFFHPHRIIGWHLYERETRIPHWEDHPQWHAHEHRSMRLIRDIILQKKKGMEHLGRSRSIKDYEKYTGIKLIHKK
jgi:hypothetical protein